MNEGKSDGAAVGSAELLEMQALLEAEKRGCDLWRNECQLICDTLADIVGEERYPSPGWMLCVDKIKKMISNASAQLTKVG